MQSKVLNILLAVTLVTGSSAASACSMAPGYKVPTTLELVQRAETIVLARVGEAMPDADGYGVGTLALQPETMIAGSVMPTSLTIRGQHGGPDWPVSRSNPNDLANANPDAFAGGCSRYTFDRGMLLLLFLERDSNDDWQVIDSSFARTLEDVPNADALWVRAVRYYSTVANLQRDERRNALRAEQARLRATGDADDALLAADIGRQIRGRRTQNFD